MAPSCAFRGFRTVNKQKPDFGLESEVGLSALAVTGLLRFPAKA